MFYGWHLLCFFRLNHSIFLGLCIRRGTSSPAATAVGTSRSISGSEIIYRNLSDIAACFIGIVGQNNLLFLTGLMMISLSKLQKFEQSQWFFFYYSSMTWTTRQTFFISNNYYIVLRVDSWLRWNRISGSTEPSFWLNSDMLGMITGVIITDGNLNDSFMSRCTWIQYGSGCGIKWTQMIAVWAGTNSITDGH